MKNYGIYNMKKTIIAMLLIITAVILFGCVSARKPVVLFAGNFGAEDNSKKTAFLNENNGNFFDDRPMTIMHFFNGKLTAIVQAEETPGSLTFTASAEGLRSGSVTLFSE